MPREQPVVVVGAGIVGASVAYHLARAGAAVTLIDRSLPATGVTGSSFAWIGGPGGADVPDASTPLRRIALAEHRRLERELRVPVRWTGSLRWGGDLPDEADLGPHEQLVDAARVTEVEPHLRVPPEHALHTTSDGALDAVAATEALVRGAAERGAELAVGVEVTAVRIEGRQAVGVDTSRGFVPCGTVVLAAGTDAPGLCAPLGIEPAVAPSPALLLRFAAPPGLVRTLVAAPDIEVREAADGLLLAALDHRGEVGGQELRRRGLEAQARLRAMFAGAADVELLDVSVGVRPMPDDGLPVVGPLPGRDGVYVAVMHSGVTLAPAVGRLVATEIVDGVPPDELRGLGPGRARRADGGATAAGGADAT